MFFNIIPLLSSCLLQGDKSYSSMCVFFIIIPLLSSCLLHEDKSYHSMHFLLSFLSFFLVFYTKIKTIFQCFSYNSPLLFSCLLNHTAIVLFSFLPGNAPDRLVPLDCQGWSSQMLSSVTRKTLL